MFSSKKWALTCQRCGKEVRAIHFVPPNAEIVCLSCVHNTDESVQVHNVNLFQIQDVIQTTNKENL